MLWHSHLYEPWSCYLARFVYGETQKEAAGERRLPSARAAACRVIYQLGKVQERLKRELTRPERDVAGVQLAI